MNRFVHALQSLKNNSILQTLWTYAKRNDVELYLVGGSVRDLFLNRSSADFDFTLASNAVDFAKMFAASINAPLIPLEEQPPTARVIIRTQSLTPLPPLSRGKTPIDVCVDFTQFRAATLSDDLRLRDLTINAMAIPLRSIIDSEQFEVLDPCNGMKDLERRKLQFPNEAVIFDDPLRTLRIFRFACQLDFSITQDSMSLVERHAHLLPNVSKERIRDELMKILNVEKTRVYLEKMSDVNLLTYIIPSFKTDQIIWQHLGNFEECPVPIPLYEYQNEIDSYLSEDLGLYANRRSLIKLSIVGQNHLGGVRPQLCLSRKAAQFMKSIVTGHQQLANRTLEKNQIIDFLRAAGDEWWGVLLYANALKPISPSILETIVETYYKHIVPIRNRGRLITGNDLICKYDMKPGKGIGRLLDEIEKLQYYGEIRTREEAFATIERLVQDGD